MSTISASTTTTTAYTVSADTTGALVLQTGATPTTAVTVNASGAVGVGSSPSYGTSGQVLTSAGSSAVPTWSTPSAVKILQVVSVTYGTGTSISSTSYTDTGLTASITPSSSSNKVLVIVSNNAISQTQATANRQYGLIIVRGSTTVLTKYWSSYAPTVAGYSEISIDGSMLYLDSPATTSSTTYKIQGKVNDTSSSTQLKLNSDGNAQSTITLMEVAP